MGLGYWFWWWDLGWVCCLFDLRFSWFKAKEWVHCWLLVWGGLWCAMNLLLGFGYGLLELAVLLKFMGVGY